MRTSQDSGCPGGPRPASCECRGGQITLEYAMLLAVALAALTGIQLYAKRGIQSAVKQAADRLSPCAPPPPGVALSPLCRGVDRQGETAQLWGMLFESGDRLVKHTVQPGQVLGSTSGTTTSVTDPGAVTSRVMGINGTVTRRHQEETVTKPALVVVGPSVSAYSSTVADVNP